MAKATAIGPVTNGAANTIVASAPYIARARCVGLSDFISHRWNCEAVEAKSKAAKGSAAKKSDDLESYVYRNDDGEVCIPGEYLRGALVNAARYRQDPRSPRKSAQDLFKAAVVVLTPLASLGVKDWQYEHRCRVTVQRSGITRVRPAMKAGWSVEFDILVNLPEYVPPDVLQSTLVDAGRLVGLGDFRPTYGRFAVTLFEAATADSVSRG